MDDNKSENTKKDEAIKKPIKKKWQDPNIPNYLYYAVPVLMGLLLILRVMQEMQLI